MKAKTIFITSLYISIDFLNLSLISNGAPIGTVTGIYDLSNEIIGKAIQIALKANNLARQCHNVTNFTLDANLTASSQSWSKYMGNISTLQHYPDVYAFGENIFFACRYKSLTNISYLALTAAQNFYNEIKYYNYSNPRYTSNTGHFTQMIWKSSTRFGFGMTLTNTTVSGFPYQCIWIVMRYLPYGNIAYASTYRRNVLPPIGTPNWDLV